MTNQPNIPKEQALVPEDQTPQNVAPDITQETRDLVTKEMPEATAEIQNETMALFETIRLKAQSEMRKAQQEAERAGESTREAYLDSVRNAREEIERLNLFDPERIEYTIKLMQMDAENNWENMVKQASELGERLNDAALAAWTALTTPKTYTEAEERSIDDSKKLD